MNYQVGNRNPNNQIFDNTGFVKNQSSILGRNSVGDLLAGTLVKGGTEPVLDINGIQLKTKAAKELEDAKPGDTIYMKIQRADHNQVSLKIVGVGSAQSGATDAADTKAAVTGKLNGMQMDAAAAAQVMQNTEQVSNLIKDNLDGALDEAERKENQEEILRSVSTEEIAQLRRMQIDVTNATLSDLMGMVITIRSNEHQDEMNEVLSDIVESTLGKIEDAVKPDVGKVQQPEPEFTETTAEPVMTSKLNSEGYVVTKPVVPANAQTRRGMSEYGVENVEAEEPKQNAPVEITQEQMIYLIQNGMHLTISNIYTAQNSVNESSPSQELPFNEQVWNDIYPQVTGVIEAAGITVNEQSLNAAKFMLTHELPITVDSMRLYMSVHALNQRGFVKEQVRENIEEQVAIGNDPEQARISGSTTRERAAQILEKVKQISGQTIDSAVYQGKPLTISYLYQHALRNVDVRSIRRPVTTGVEGASLSLSGNGKTAEAAGQTASVNPMAVTARRQLEEIRLSMTMEAAIRLVRTDFNIDARPLSEVVDALRQQENTYYDAVVSSHDIHELPDDVDLLKETLKETDALKNLPAFALGEVVKRPDIMVEELYGCASRMKQSLARNAYETMMTKPRQDMGDSMSEAFQNVDAILEDLNLDRNEVNQRAVKILAYNEMELTNQNIVSVKEADAKVQQMFETLTPQIVLNLIRENKNPLHMTIDGLNEEIMQQRQLRGITDEQKFSEFLYQLDKNGEITQEERTGFIGIYRLLDKVEKSHGKDIGAIVRNGQEVTLENLFTADRSRRAQGFNVAVDDSFGERVNVEENGKGILHQIETAYNQTLTGSILRHITPDTLKSLENVDYRNMPFEELNALVKAGDRGEGDEELLEELHQTLQQALSYEESVETMLDANDLPKTVTNVIAAQQVMFGEDGIYGMVHGIKRSLSEKQQERVTEAEDRLLQNLDSASDVVYGMENLRAMLSDTVHEKEQDGTITALDIQALKYLNAGMPIAMQAAWQDEFRIPLVVDGSVSMMKISVVQDGSHAGEITATMQTPQYGALEAFVRMEDNELEGYITVEEEAGQSVLESNELTFRSVFAKGGVEMRDLRLDGTKPMLYGRNDASGEVGMPQLYRVTKQLLTAIKLTGVAADN